jgi:MoaA/NifB/PqqE/SkfB family radical SAM enzyme
MYKLEDIRDVHLELTSKCQARCPMCPRRINGGILNPLITLDEITLAQFKEWFTVEFIQQLDSLFMCGNLGDPIIAQDCLEIFQYLRTTNPRIRLSMHTNGSARQPAWWKALAETSVRVTFGLDGLTDTHTLYRVGTDFDQIMRNATAFIKSGGIAEWHMLVFEHNEAQVEDCRILSEKLGFSKFTVKHTSRFTDGKFHVLDELGRTTHILRPTDRSTSMVSLVKDNAQSTTITCKAVKYKQIYIAADGTVSPCCWLDLKWQLPKQDNRINYMDTIGAYPNLNSDSLIDIFSLGYFDKIESTWTDTPLLECSKQCGKFDKLGEQFVN